MRHDPGHITVAHLARTTDSTTRPHHLIRNEPRVTLRGMILTILLGVALAVAMGLFEMVTR